MLGIIHFIQLLNQLTLQRRPLKPPLFYQIQRPKSGHQFFVGIGHPDRVLDLLQGIAGVFHLLQTQYLLLMITRLTDTYLPNLILSEESTFLLLFQRRVCEWVGLLERWQLADFILGFFLILVFLLARITLSLLLKLPLALLNIKQYLQVLFIQMLPPLALALALGLLPPHLPPLLLNLRHRRKAHSFSLFDCQF